MITPKEARAKLTEHENREEQKQQDFERFCADFFDTDAVFRRHVETKIENGIERAIGEGGRPLYVLVYDGHGGSRNADCKGVSLRWAGERWPWDRHEEDNVCTACIDATKIPYDAEGKANTLCSILENHLKRSGWETRHCGSRDGETNLLRNKYIGYRGRYAAFRLYYERG